MRKVINGLYVSLILIISNIGFSQGFEFKYFNPLDLTYTIDDWMMHQLIRESEENGLLIIELLNENNKNISLSNQAFKLQQDSSLMADQLLNKDAEIKDLKLENKYTEDLYEECLKTKIYDDKDIRKISFALKREQLKNKWLSWTTGITTVATLVYIIRALVNK